MSRKCRIRVLTSVAGSSRATIVVLVALVSMLGLRPAHADLDPFLPISELEGNEYAPAIAYNSNHDEYLVVWHDVYEVVHARRVSSTGQLLNSFDVSTSPNGKRQASVAYDPIRDRYLVTWLYDYYGNGSNLDIYGRFIPWDGPSAGLQDFPISNWTSDQSRPVVAYAQTADEFLVAWVNSAPAVPTYISGRRIFADGSGFPPGDGFPISSGAEDRDFPDVAYNLARNEYLVTWDLELSASNLDIYGERLRGDGISLTGGDPNVVGEFPIAGWPAVEEHPSVAACDKDNQYLVTWQSDQDSSGSDFAIYARYLNGDAVPGGVYLVDDTTSPEMNAAVTCNQGGRQYLIAWQTRYTNLHYGIWARLAQPNGSMKPAFGLVQPGTSTDRAYPAVGGGGSQYLVAWEHKRDGTGYQDIHGRLVVPAMQVLPLVRR